MAILTLPLSILVLAAGSARRRARLLLAGWLATLVVLSAAPPPKEYQVKAVFLFNFTQFVLWPSDAFASPDAPIKIGVLGADPFGTALDEAVFGERVRDRPVVVEHYARPADVRPCHVLYIATSEAANLDRILRELDGRPVLTVSDIPNFAHRGGAVNFFLEGSKVKLEINTAVARRTRLRLNAQLLSLARLVPGGNAGEGDQP